eukprot:scaffold10568_cov140-Skeletonema_dohrnii-CCMP3373.AAC.13
MTFSFPVPGASFPSRSSTILWYYCGINDVTLHFNFNLFTYLQEQDSPLVCLLLTLPSSTWPVLHAVSGIVEAVLPTHLSLQCYFLLQDAKVTCYCYSYNFMFGVVKPSQENHT